MTPESMKDIISKFMGHLLDCLEEYQKMIPQNVSDYYDLCVAELNEDRLSKLN